MPTRMPRIDRLRVTSLASFALMIASVFLYVSEKAALAVVEARQCTSCPDVCEQWWCSPEGCVVTSETDFCRYPGVGCPQGDFAVGTCCHNTGCPILLDLEGDGIELSDAAEGVAFPIGPTDRNFQIAWTRPGSDDAWLVLDRNGNGAIDNGTELFGNASPQPEADWRDKHGYLALAEFDKPENGGNGDGQIDARDAVFGSLRLWRDLDHDGRSRPVELVTLTSVGIRGLSLNYRESRRNDEHGNAFRYVARVMVQQWSTVSRRSVDVFLRLVPLS